MVDPDAHMAARAGRLTFVLVHGAWHGGWCWRRVSARLMQQGHRVFAPTLTGLGERRHLLSASITLETFVRDICNVIEFEELRDIVLVGHSFGGAVIGGVAAEMPERICRLVYLDALVLEPGQCPFNVFPPEVIEARRASARETSAGISLPVPPAEAFGVFCDPDAAWLRRRLTPHPLGPYESAVRSVEPCGCRIPRTYIACTDPPYEPFRRIREKVRRSPDWDWREIATGHDAMVTDPEGLALLLDSVASNSILLTGGSRN